MKKRKIRSKNCETSGRAGSLEMKFVWAAFLIVASFDFDDIVIFLPLFKVGELSVSSNSWFRVIFEYIKTLCSKDVRICYHWHHNDWALSWLGQQLRWKNEIRANLSNPESLGKSHEPVPRAKSNKFEDAFTSPTSRTFPTSLPLIFFEIWFFILTGHQLAEELVGKLPPLN